MLDIANLDGFEDQVSSAVASHSRWKRQLKDAIDGGVSDWTPEFVRDCHKCQFGAWLDSVPTEYRDEHFHSTVEIHRQFHLTASNILEMALAGQTEHARAMISPNGAYAKVSTRLISCLAQWRSLVK